MDKNFDPISFDSEIHAIIIRKCTKNFKSLHSDFTYPKYGYVEAPDWNPDITIPGGGLHGTYWGLGNLHLNFFGSIYQLIIVEKNKIVKINNDKVKFPCGFIIFSSSDLQDTIKELQKYIPKDIKLTRFYIDESENDIKIGETEIVQRFGKIQIGLDNVYQLTNKDGTIQKGGASSVQKGGFRCIQKSGTESIQIGNDYSFQKTSWLSTQTAGHNSIQLGFDKVTQTSDHSSIQKGREKSTQTTSHHSIQIAEEKSTQTADSDAIQIGKQCSQFATWNAIQVSSSKSKQISEDRSTAIIDIRLQDELYGQIKMGHESVLIIRILDHNTKIKNQILVFKSGIDFDIKTLYKWEIDPTDKINPTVTFTKIEEE